MSETQAQSRAPMAPTLGSRIDDASGRGILPVSLHIVSAPQLMALDQQPLEEVSSGLQRQYLTGNNMTFVKWIAKAGAKVPLQHHMSEQFTWITSGACEVYSQGKKYLMKAGDLMLIPSNVPHEFLFLQDTIDIDIFAPARQDWLDSTSRRPA